MNVAGRIERLEAQAVEGCPACRDAALPVVLTFEGAPPGFRPAPPPERRCERCGRSLERRPIVKYMADWRAHQAG